MAPDNDDAVFDRLTEDWDKPSSPYEAPGPTPYGGPTRAPRSGLTRRGKAVIAIGGAVLAGAGLVGYQVHEANAVKAQEIALKQQALDLQKLQELNRAAATNQKAQSSADKARQASVNKCVKDQSGTVGKGFGNTYRDIVDACQAQYTSTSGTDMQEAAASQNSGSDLNQGVLVGVVVLGAFVIGVARLGRRSNPA